MKASLVRLMPLILIAGFGVSACGSDAEDLDRYINVVKARPGGRIEPLPEITPYEIFTYIADAEGHRSPFAPALPQAQAGVADDDLKPDEKRSREFLEQFPLDTLRMVGTMQLGESNFGLVQTSDGLIHRVIPGNYMGQNDGRIVEVNDSEIELIEMISDGLGGYLEREAAVALVD